MRVPGTQVGSRWTLRSDADVREAEKALRVVFEKYGEVKNVYLPGGPW